MKTIPFSNTIETSIRTLLICTLMFLGLVSSAFARPELVSQWGIFEQRLSSSKVYDNPAQKIRVWVSFVAPTGETNRVYAFWDGGKRWRIRFSPDHPGLWRYFSECSDAGNKALNSLKGEFRCVPSQPSTPLLEHGHPTVKGGASHFVYDDGTPFFWLSDGVVEGARKARTRDWTEYVESRSAQGFNVALWKAAPGRDERGREAFSGNESIELNLPFLRRLDDIINISSESGMVSAIIPIWEIGVPDDELLPEDQVIVLLREMVGRWDAQPVVWVIAFDADVNGRRAARWRRIGRTVFGRVNHSPVILFCGSTYWAFKEFDNVSWVDAVAFQTGNVLSDEATLWLARGPVTGIWKSKPTRPMLNLFPGREAGSATDGHRITSAEALEVLARSLFVAPPAGLSYWSRAVSDWDQRVDTNTLAITGQKMTEWQKSLYLPGAKRLKAVHELLEEHSFETLSPSPELLAPSPAPTASSPVSVIADSERDRILIFLPKNTTAQLREDVLREGFVSTAINLLSDERIDVAPTSVSNTVEFSAPGDGDWLLLIKNPSR